MTTDEIAAIREELIDEIRADLQAQFRDEVREAAIEMRDEWIASELPELRAAIVAELQGRMTP